MSYGIPRHACSCEHGHDMDYPPCPRCAAAGQPPLTDEELSRLEAVVAGKPILTRLLAGFLDAQELLAEQLAALEALRNEIEVRVTLHMGTAEEIEEKIDACERLADGGEFRKTLVTEILRVRAHCDALADENDRLAVREGHGQPCYYCSAACDSGAGDPGRWPIPLPHAEEPGVVKWHHAGCVASRLREHSQARPHPQGPTMTLPDFTPSQRERLGRAAHASCPRHAPWEALFPAARAAFEEQGVAVAREMLAMLAESDAPTPPPPTLAERVAAATERRFFLDAGMRPR